MSEAKQKPSVGRIVIYTRLGSADGTHLPEPSPAIITKVEEDGQSCQMTVFNPNGMYFSRVPYSEVAKPGHWSWPERV